MAQRRISCSAFVYIISNRSRRLCVGATTDLPVRVRQHREGTYPNAFTARYKFYRLVYFEPHTSYSLAIKRERQIKSWARQKKVALIQAKNPRWNDLSVDLMELFMAK